MNNFLIVPILDVAINPGMYAIWIGIGLLVITIIFLIFYCTVFRKRNKKIKAKFDNNAWIAALGNKENIVEISGVGSRLSVKLVDKDKIDREKLKELGVSSVLVMSNKVTLVVEGQAEKLSEILNANL